HSESGRTDEHGVRLGPAGRADEKLNCLVASPRSKHPVRGHVIESREALNQCPGLRLRIPVEPGSRVIAWRAPAQIVCTKWHTLRLPGGVLVGLKRDNLRPCDLRDPAHVPTPAATSALAASSRSRRRITAFACASSPSSLASVMDVEPSDLSPAGESSCTGMILTKSRTESPLIVRAAPAVGST